MPEGGDFGRTIKPLSSIVGVGGEDGDNSSLGAEHDSRQPGIAGPNPVGDGGGGQCNVPELSWDEPLKLGGIKARFWANTKRLKESSRCVYWEHFRRFAKDSGGEPGKPRAWTYHRFERFTKRDLQGDKGKQLLQAFYDEIPPFSRTTMMAGVRKVWRRGLDLEWPLDRDDLEQPPSPRLTPGPRREDVGRWVEAARNEQNVYESAWFSVELTFGLRNSNQQANLKRRNVVYNAVGEPIGFVAHGREEDFKKDSYLIAAMPKDVAKAVGAWLKVHPDASPEAWLFPYRGATGLVDPKRRHNEASIGRMRSRFARRWSLPYLTSKAMRKFVKATLIDAGMPRPERDYWQGHKPPRNDMDVTYGNRSWEEVLARQLGFLPDGPIGTFAQVRLTAQGVPAEVVNLWRRFQTNELDAMDLVNELKALKRQLAVDLLRPNTP